VDLESEIDRLYGVPLDEFIAQRDELAKRLNREGDREAGASVKALRKPTVGAWALNQAIRRRRKETAALLATAERLRTAQEALLSGGDPGELRKAVREERELTSTLADSAEAIASEAGKSGPALRDRVRATLHAAAVDEEARAELESGRFVKEREAVGLGAFGTAPAGGAATPTRAPARKPPARRRERSAAKPARPPKSTPGGRQPAPEEAASGARGAASAAERAAAREDAARQARLAEAETELAEAREAHEAAVAEHDSALSALESARETLHEAEVSERDARRVMREHEREVAKRERKLDRMRPKR
jgi:hypothetical protein